MTIRQLIERLEDYDKDAQIYIGTQQRYGSDFAYTISDAVNGGLTAFWGADEKDVVFLIADHQCGTMDLEEEDW